MLKPKQIFLAEDDRYQMAAIQAAIANECKRLAGVRAEFTLASSEHEARQKVAASGANSLPLPDVYVVDLMMPWARGDVIPEPDDPRVLSEGPLRAGFRVIEAILQRETEVGPGQSRKPHIILYTIAGDHLTSDDHPPIGTYHRYQKMDDNDRGLAEAVAMLLAEDRRYSVS